MALALNDIGTALDCTVEDENGIVDLTTASVLQILLKRPNGTVLTKTATLLGIGSAGTLRYITQAGDLDTLGAWEIRAHIALPAGAWTTQPKSFMVK